MRRRKEFERVNDSCGDISLDAPRDTPWEEALASKEYDPNSEHPTPEQLLIREATKFLTPKQRKIWEFYNFDRMTQDEIAKKLKIGQPRVAKHIAASEARIAKWVKSNMGAYKLLKGDLDK